MKERWDEAKPYSNGEDLGGRRKSELRKDSNDYGEGGAGEREEGGENEGEDREKEGRESRKESSTAGQTRTSISSEAADRC